MVTETAICHTTIWSSLCAGAELDPLQVLSALPDSMPLTAGADILARMMCERMHRHRQGSIVRSLQKSVHLSTTVQRVEVSFVKHICDAVALQLSMSHRCAI